MEIEVYFDGCSCGCTPYEHVLFEGHEPDIYIAIASWALNYTISGDPFRKLDIPEESKKYCERAFEIMDRIKDLESQKTKLDSEIQKLEDKQKKYEDASELLGVAIPDNIIQTMSELKDQEFLLRDESNKLKDRISELNANKAQVLTYDYSRARRYYDDDDDE